MPVLDLVHQLCCITMSSNRPQSLSWRGFAEAYVINFVTLLITIHLKDIFFKSDNFFLQCGIYTLFLMLFNFLYQKFQSL